MIKIRITWPLLILIMLALFAWLIREPAARPARKPKRQAGPRRRPMIINQDGDDRRKDDYDEETARLDRAAFATAQEANAQHQRPRNPLRHKEYNRDRTTATR